AIRKGSECLVIRAHYVPLECRDITVQPDSWMHAWRAHREARSQIESDPVDLLKSSPPRPPGAHILPVLCCHPRMSTIRCSPRIQLRLELETANLIRAA